MSTVKTGWLKDNNGDKFAPKTLTSQVQTSDGILIEDKIQADLDDKAPKDSPVFTGSISMGRESGSTVGTGSVALGGKNIASGNYSHAEGYYTIASSAYQHVQGQYNIEDTESKYLHIVGNAMPYEERSNAHTLDWDGNAEFAGDVVAYGCGCDTENPVRLSDFTHGKYRTSIPENDDLNDYIKVGLFRCSKSATVETLINCPVSTDIFNLDVISTHGTTIIQPDSWSYIIQILRAGGGVEWFRKISTNATGTIIYGNWLKTLNSGDVVNNLTNTSTTAVLSAAQGKALNDKIAALYPVGSIYTTSTNTNPSSILGGTWTLTGKLFKEAYIDNPSGILTLNNCSAGSSHVALNGNVISFKANLTNSVELSDSSVKLATINLSKIGITRFSMTHSTVGYSDNGNVILMVTIDYSTGAINCVDIVGADSIASGKSIEVFLTTTVRTAYMLDSFCDRFYWKRTA